MKIIFLDIDGVLNSRRYDVHRKENEGNIDVTRLVILKQLIEKTNARIILTSSWRCHWDPNGENTDETGKELIETFARYGIELYGKTPQINDDRAEEIRVWLNGHSDVDGFVIFDDIKLGWGELEPNVVKTDPRIGCGLEQRHCEMAIRILLSP